MKDETVTKKSTQVRPEKPAGDIHTKLLAFQQLGISIKKDKKNPHFKSDYASLNEVLDKIKGPLSELGVVMMQVPDEIGLITTLYDTGSGTSIQGRLNFMGATDPQKLGSNLTYYRRYSLVTMLGLEDDDDDGNQATQAPRQAAPQKPKIALSEAFALLRGTSTIKELEDAYRAFPAELKKDPEVIAVATEVKERIINTEPVID